MRRWGCGVEGIGKWRWMVMMHLLLSVATIVGGHGCRNASATGISPGIIPNSLECGAPHLHISRIDSVAATTAVFDVPSCLLAHVRLHKNNDEVLSWPCVPFSGRGVSKSIQTGSFLFSHSPHYRPPCQAAPFLTFTFLFSHMRVLVLNAAEQPATTNTRNPATRRRKEGRGVK
jgi:hypothetical protein